METAPSGVGGSAAFHTTHWTVVLEAGSHAKGGSHDAFARIYLDYWYPLYAYIRRRGYSPSDAEDITQDFFVHLIQGRSLDGLDRKGAKFRTFLLRLLNNFLANVWDRSRAQKRGAGEKPLTLDIAAGEAQYAAEPSHTETPEVLFERQWVRTLLNRTLEEIRGECEAECKAALFADLRPHLQGDELGPPYAEVAARHGMSEGAVKVAAHRLRQRYGEMLRAEIARTVSTLWEVDDELRYLIALVRR